MEAESKPFIEHLKLHNITSQLFPKQVPFLAFNGKHGNNGDSDDDDDDTVVTVITNGKDHIYETNVDNCGTVPAAVATFAILQKLSNNNNNNQSSCNHTSSNKDDGNNDDQLQIQNIPPIDLIINAGTCGGFQRMGGTIGDVYITTGVANHDRRIPIPNFDKYGIGHLATNIDYIEHMATALHYKTGICTTGNSLDNTTTDDEFMISNNASVKDMEAAAIAWCCQLYNIPFMGMKGM